MSPLLLLLCSCLVKLAASAPDWTVPEVFLREHAEMHFERFIQEHNKQYLDETEKQARLEIFIDNLERANALNQESDHAVFGITKFSDLTPEEFTKHFMGLGDPASINSTGASCKDVFDSQIPNHNAPDAFDWRDHNVVTRVKDQGSCGGCYAFSASGNIEGQYALKHGRLIELSEQQTVDCDTHSNGCRGGFMDKAFRSIIQQGGIETEADYPYVARKQRCSFSPRKAAVRLTGCNTYRIVSQEKLKQLLYKYGPISVAVQADNFQAYHGGIMADQVCNSGRINHAVLLVGYGEEKGKKFWILKNSWGEVFGETGYIRIQRGENAQSCKMMNEFMASSTIMSLIKQGGSESEADYPYEANDTFSCRFDANKVKVKLDDCRSFNLTSQEKLKQLLYHRGPIAIGVKAKGLQPYKKGIISDEQCDKGDINHGVLLVGYGSEGDKPFWIAKNSWGLGFGEDGYFRMERGEGALSCILWRLLSLHKANYYTHELS